MAVLFALPTTHWVEDVIGVEPEKVVQSGWKAWRFLADVLGLGVSDEKSPMPARSFQVIGLLLDLTRHPPVVMILQRRIDALGQLID